MIGWHSFPRQHGCQPPIPEPHAFLCQFFQPRSQCSLIDCISVGVDRMQRNCAPVRWQVEEKRCRELRRRVDGNYDIFLLEASRLRRHERLLEVSR
jgi:hypothetical protein